MNDIPSQLDSLVTLDDYKQAYIHERDKNQLTEGLLESKGQELQESKQQLQDAIGRLKRQQKQLVAQEKMASIGQLAAGVAHEINNPLAFIISNLNTLKDYIVKYRLIYEKAEIISALIENNNFDHAYKAAEFIKKQTALDDIEYIVNDTDLLISETHEGLNRVKDIVSNLKGFSRTKDDYQEADLNEVIISTLNLARNELKYNCEVINDLSEISNTYCNVNEIKQVILNIVLNAVHAIKHEKGRIEVKSWMEDDNVCISISDNGMGIDADKITHIFNPFFTTKPPGQGTGLGLYVAYTIIDHHDGRIVVSSNKGEGSCFTVYLPVAKP